MRVRVPFGTYVSINWGLVRGTISSLRLVKLSEEQVNAYVADIANPSTKKVIMVTDGFSHYSSPGNRARRLMRGTFSSIETATSRCTSSKHPLPAWLVGPAG